MSDTFRNSLAGFGFIQNQIDAGREERRQSGLGQLMGQVAAGQQPDYAQIGKLGGDPMGVRKWQDERSQAALRKAGQVAAWVLAQPAERRAQAWQQAHGQIAPIGAELGLPAPPPTYSPDLDSELQFFAHQFGGVGATQNEPRIVAPGSALVTNDGRVVYERPGLPKASQYIPVPDGNGGTILMENTPEGLRPPQFGSQPPMGTPQVPMPQGMESPVGDFATNATQIASLHGFRPTSLQRSPQENARIPGASPTSRHLDGQAIDLSIQGKSNAEIQAVIAAYHQQGYTGGIHTKGSAPHLHFEAPRGQAPQGAPQGRLGYNPPKPQGGEESYGQPMPVTDPVSGKVVMVQFGNRGGRRVVSDYEPGPTSRDSKPPTEGERNAAGYMLRMAEAEKAMGEIEGDGFVPGALSDKLTAGQGLRNYAATPQAQEHRQQQEDWVRAKLRKESGAVIGADEMEREIQTYFAQPGDAPPVIARKKRSREIAIEAMRSSAGRASDIQAPPAASNGGWSIQRVD